MTYPTGGILTGEEAKRLDSLDSFALMDTPADSRLDSLTQLAARLIGTPIATVTLVDHERQWLKSAVGLQQGVSAPRDISFCAHVVRHPNQPMVVEDASQDPRFADNPFVTGTPHIRFYAGIPLVDEAGLALGALCVIDTKPRQISNALLDRLADIGAGVMSALYLQRSNAALQKSEVFARQILAASTSCIDVLDLDGRILFTNPTSREALELAPDETIDGTPWEEQWPEAEQPRIRDQIEAARAGRRHQPNAVLPYQ